MVDVAQYQKSDFWKKKIRAAIKYRDADRDGTISKGDFELIWERYKKLSSSTSEHSKSLSKMVTKFVDDLGLSDPETKLTYEQYEKRWMASISKPDTLATEEAYFKELFCNLDADGSGNISFKEWEHHCSAYGIPIEHARDSFEAMDVDKDNYITEEEFVKYHMEFFFSAENKLNSKILFGPL